jgi:hypothetical protein
MLYEFNCTMFTFGSRAEVSITEVSTSVIYSGTSNEETVNAECHCITFANAIVKCLCF